MGILEIYSIFLLFSLLLFTGAKIFSISTRSRVTSTLELNQITVIIPFRNEARCLPFLLQSIENQENLPFEVLFIDDHSTDFSSSVINSFIHDNNFGSLLKLPDGKMGKKEALNLGVTSAQTSYVLTLDADVVLDKHYFNSLLSKPQSVLLALPVVMKGKGFFDRFFATEYSFFNAFNFLIARIWPISISGANLLINKTAINYENQLLGHKHIASGDDYFLLKYFRRSKQSIYFGNNIESSVVTQAPSSFKSYFDQRVRWLSKSKYKAECRDTIIGVFMFVYFIGGVFTLIVAGITGDWVLLLSIFMMRLLLDAIVYLNYAQRLRETRNVLMLPFFQIFYPFLLIVVGALSVFYRPKWKGRKV
ncbi:glycosyltransferase [Brumimicrobium oceani]|uniref:Glycosyltransferase 2-like domain-containing protein n=1 Tax=Brumimicrobium oceani TaxID=2100725 RepID=A0A2U2X0M3_9FLAO|nr:glycosyltransferase [Brumimicrobium oceani]PWH81321.1 hypothetical protein DIT68_15410 [Brumimicrobium oceani]